MKITQDVRAYAKAQGIKDLGLAVEKGMKSKSDEFRKMGGEIYRDV
jgi:hypothetical protein